MYLCRFTDVPLYHSNRYCVLLFTISSQDHSYHRFILRKIAKEDYWIKNGVRFLYISEDVQKGFKIATGDSDMICKNDEPALKVCAFHFRLNQFNAIRLIDNHNLSMSLQPLPRRRLVGDLSILCRYFNGYCSQEIGYIIPAPLRRVRIIEAPPTRSVSMFHFLLHELYPTDH